MSHEIIKREGSWTVYDFWLACYTTTVSGEDKTTLAINPPQIYVIYFLELKSPTVDRLIRRSPFFYSRFNIIIISTLLAYSIALKATVGF